MNRIYGGLVAMLLLAVGSVGCADDPVCGDYPLDDDQRICVVETIEEMVDETYPFADYKGVDLGEFSVQLREALEHDSDESFLRAVNYSLRLLEDGHTRMERRALEEAAVAAVDIRRVDGDIRVVAADDEWTELIGHRVNTIDGVDAHQALDKADTWVEGGADGEAALWGSQLALAGEAGTTLELGLEGGQKVRMQRESLFDEPEVRRYGDDIAYLRLETFRFVDDIELIDQAINEVMDTRGLIVDLRGNGGGFPSVVEGLFGRLIQEDKPSFNMVDIDGDLHRELKASPRGEIYDGEVVLLSDRGTYSASNYFAHRLVYHDRGIIIGEQTGGGAAAPARVEQLVPGIWFRVSTYVVTTPEGDHSESGIPATIPVDVEEAANGDDGEEATGQLSITGDPVKDRALHYLEALQ